MLVAQAVDMPRLVHVAALAFVVALASSSVGGSQALAGVRAARPAPSARAKAPGRAQRRLAPRPAPRATAPAPLITKRAKLTPAGQLSQLRARISLLASRAFTFPAHFWPFNRIARMIAHGEPLAGLSPRDAARAARRIAAEGGTGVIVGRLAPTLRDDHSVRGAEKSFMRLIDELAAAKAANPRLRPAIAYDPDSLGLGLAGRSAAEREQIATESMLRIAHAAKRRGVAVELDSTDLDTLPITHRIAERIVIETGAPVRLALAARYHAADGVLDRWADLAEKTGVRLGVRLVKGSYVESRPGIENLRPRLMNRYERLISRALSRSKHLDVAVATQNERIWQHAEAEAARLGATYKVHVIRGVNPELQARMRAKGVIGAEYISYGLDAPAFGISEMIGSRQAKRRIIAAFAAQLD